MTSSVEAHSLHFLSSNAVVQRPFFDPLSVVISALISGVEMMDALVGGMNSFGKDDFFMVSGGISPSTTRDKDKFRPLYEPRLPIPPLGVTLGGGLSRRKSSTPRMLTMLTCRCKSTGLR